MTYISMAERGGQRWEDVRERAVELLERLRFPDERPVGPVFRVLVEGLSIGVVEHARYALNDLLATVDKAAFHFETKLRPKWMIFCHLNRLENAEGALSAIYGVLWSQAELQWNAEQVRAELVQALEAWHNGKNGEPFVPISGANLRDWLNKAK